MRGIVVALLLCPSVAIADQTVETKDGRHILLRDDGSYRVLPSGPTTCQNKEKYFVIDYHYRNLSSDLRDLKSKRAPVCTVGDIMINHNASEEMIFKFSTGEPSPLKYDGVILTKDLTTDDRVYILDNCNSKWCRVVVYGNIANHIWDNFGIYAEKIEFAKQE